MASDVELNVRSGSTSQLTSCTEEEAEELVMLSDNDSVKLPQLVGGRTVGGGGRMYVVEPDGPAVGRDAVGNDAAVEAAAMKVEVES